MAIWDLPVASKKFHEQVASSSQSIRRNGSTRQGWRYCDSVFASIHRLFRSWLPVSSSLTSRLSTSPSTWHILTKISEDKHDNDGYCMWLLLFLHHFRSHLLFSSYWFYRRLGIADPFGSKKTLPLRRVFVSHVRSPRNPWLWEIAARFRTIFGAKEAIWFLKRADFPFSICVDQ